MTEKRKPGRPRGASSRLLANGERGARVTLTIDGERVRRRMQLETSDPAVADVKIERLQSTDHRRPPLPRRDTFREVSAVVLAAREARGICRVDVERGRIELHVLPFVGKLRSEPFGDRALATITADEVTELLSAKRDEGYAFEQVKKIRAGMKYVFEHHKLSVMAHAPMPPFQAALKKQRAVASDEVLLAYLSWEHPIERFRVGVRMRQAMSAVSRCIGGQRTNDLHVATWEDNLMVPERGEPSFEEVWVPRTKGQAPQLLETPEGVRPMLRRWWEQSGRPRKGPVFPLLRGERAGEARDEVQDSHAYALRQDLRRALGLDVWDPRGGKRLSGAWVTGREPTAKERALFEEGRYTLPLDFHSWRRAWSQALKKVGANVQTSAALTGHASDLRAHGRYLSNPTEAMAVPAGVVPQLLRGNPGQGVSGVSPPAVSGSANPASGVPCGKVLLGHELARTQGGHMAEKSDSLMISLRARSDSNGRPTASEVNSEGVFQGFRDESVTSGHLESDDERTHENGSGQNSRAIIEDPDELLRATVIAMMAAGDIDAATALLEVARRRKAPLPDNIRKLGSYPTGFRKGKS